MQLQEDELVDVDMLDLEDGPEQPVEVAIAELALEGGPEQPVEGMLAEGQEDEEDPPAGSPTKGKVGTSGQGSRNVRRRQAPVVHCVSIRPRAGSDLQGHLVTDHELIRYDKAKLTEAALRWEFATVMQMFKTQQVKNPTYYNVRTNGPTTVTKSVELVPGGTWSI